MFHIFSVLRQGPSIYLSFHFHLFSLCGLLEQQNPSNYKFSFFVNYFQVFISGQDKVICLYLKIPEKFMCLIL